MKFEWRIPFFLIARHLWRGSKWTLALIIFLMAIAFINLVFVSSLFNGIIDSSDRKTIETYTGNVSIYPLVGDDFITNTKDTLNKIRATDGVVAATAHYVIPASMEWNKIKASHSLAAINPDDEKKVTTVWSNMQEGRYLSANDRDGIILGTQVAGADESGLYTFKGIKTGDKVKISVGQVSKEFTVRGIFYTNSMQTDYQTFITERGLQSIAPALKGKAGAILIKIDKTGNEAAVIDRLRAHGVRGKILQWKDLAGLMKSVTKSFVSIDVLLSLVGTLIAAVTIFIVIYIDVNNKRQQIGILRALGVRPYLIQAVYVLQSAIYSFFGVILGVAMFFALLVPYFQAHPFALPIGDATLLVNYPTFILRAEIILIVAVLSGLIPAIMVTRMNMLDEIRGK
jgi:putative ABC transport system permease protein